MDAFSLRHHYLLCSELLVWRGEAPPDAGEEEPLLPEARDDFDG